MAHLHIPSIPLEVAAAALDAAKSRREQLSSKGTGRGVVPATPVVGAKRGLKADGGSTATSSTTGPPSEKVTPDPKHVRVDKVLTPKQLFGSPSADMEVETGRDDDKGGFLKKH